MLAPRLRPARMTVLLSATAVAAGLISAAPALALTGPEAPTDAYKSVVKLNIGDEETSRACTATLVDARWILTAASCFAATPGTSVPAGKPALKTVATLSDGKAVDVVELVPRSDRDLVMARLATATTGIAGIKRASAAPAAGADLTAVGFGRTKTEWVPGKLHVGSFSVGASDATALTITGKGTDAICKGDTGGPLLNAAGELVGVNSRSWQGGCLGTATTETRTGALSVRTDDLGAWVGEVTAPRNGAQVSLLAGGGGTMWSQFGNLGYREYGQAWAKVDGKDVSRVSTVRHGEIVRAYAIAGGRVFGQDLDRATGKWSGWGEVPGGAAGAKDITASLVGDTVHVLIVGSEGNLYSQAADYKAGRWNTNWTAVGATGLSHITSTASGTTVRVHGIGGGEVYGRDLDTRNGSWTAWGAIPGGAGGAVDIASSTVGNNVHVQIIGSDGAIWTQFGNYDAGRWNDSWAKAGGTGLTRITSVSTPTGIELYALGAGGKASNATMDPATGSWTAFKEVTGGLAGAADVAVAVSVPPSKVTLAAGAGGSLFTQNGAVATGVFNAQWAGIGGAAITHLTSVDTGSTIRYVGVAGGKVYDREYDVRNNTWGNWTEIPGGAGGVKDVSAAMINNVLYVQVIGSSGDLYTQTGDYNAGRWNSGWTPVAGGTGLTGISSVKAGPFVRLVGINAGKAYGRDFDTRNNTWTVWGEIPGGITGAKDITTARVGHTVQVQVIGSDGALYNQSADYLAGMWNPTWNKIGGTGLTRIASASAADNIHVYATGTNGQVQNIALDTTTGSWTAWNKIPGTLTNPADITATTTK
ncbi:trypsin-like serine protease [Streptomyces sp. NBC_00239]|uniref:trypsin-like serine protease n=1 Tax=Streptomyces sp. NBC_00239 TaxID=2903640 RepID=UPI002E2971E3|nr:trypsin-like serine protease [Streptomyces sp. NBC_00239]